MQPKRLTRLVMDNRARGRLLVRKWRLIVLLLVRHLFRNSPINLAQLGPAPLYKRQRLITGSPTAGFDLAVDIGEMLFIGHFIGGGTVTRKKKFRGSDTPCPVPP